MVPAIRPASPARRYARAYGRTVAVLAALLTLIALAGCRTASGGSHSTGTPDGRAAQDVTSGLPAGAGCMVEITTPDGHVTYYKPGRDQRIVVPNGTPHPYVARCINGAITAQPGSGDLPS